MKNQFTLLPEKVLISFKDGESLLAAMLRAKVDIDNSCGGFGTCGTCCILINKGIDKLDERNEIENEMATDRQFSKVERLSCQTQAVSGIEISLKKSK